MSKPIIEVDNVSKKYIIQHKEPYVTFRDAITGFVKKPYELITKKKSSKEELWALKDVNFSVDQGEVIGIIGRNGAGKTTILKILSKITPPTQGKIILRGRVASLLEVGTGFHPELTGRENIYLNGAILGMSKKEIKKKFAEIVEFAEINKFLDTPVKRYSSGMYVRLAFAVAAHLEPEILLVDEVLAVGDVAFQKKCLGKMKDVSQSGRTIFFVSHNMLAIQSLCSKVIRIDRGKMLGMGDVDEQIKAYIKDGSKETIITNKSALQLTPDTKLTKVKLTPSIIKTGAPINFDLQIQASDQAVINSMAIIFSSSMNVKAAIVDLRQTQNIHLTKNQTLNINGEIKSLPLVEGDYSITLYLKYDGGIEKHFSDLGEVNITGKASTNGIIPYPPAARGIIELDYEFESNQLTNK
ncbi:MAG: ABC transporter ATP-binding protein [Patescibacteria group bacterium]